MEIILIKPFYVVKKNYGRELPPKVYVPCFHPNFLYSWCLIACLHACVLLSFLFLFILYSCLYVNAFITLCLFYNLLFMFYFNFFLILCNYFFKFWDALFRFYRCNPYFLHFYCYWLSINKHQAWSRINEDEWMD